MHCPDWKSALEPAGLECSGPPFGKEVKTGMPEEIKRTHQYHAEATILHGDLYHPLVQEIKPQSNVKLSQHGGYLSEHAEPYRLEGVISFRKAYTQVAGNPDSKPGHGWSTLSTAVVEKLNILEVVTADRVVGQIATDHPLDGYVPTVHFLGTRFENLRIAGHPVNLDMHPDPSFLGEKPPNDGPYTRHPGLLDRLEKQFACIRGSKGVPDSVAQRYNGVTTNPDGSETIECSLVNSASGPYPGLCHGHVIDVPGFGKIHLAVLKIEHSDYDPEKHVWKKTLFDLKMIELEMGCIGGGKTGIVNPVTNGTTLP